MAKTSDRHDRSTQDDRVREFARSAVGRFIDHSPMGHDLGVDLEGISGDEHFILVTKFERGRKGVIPKKAAESVEDSMNYLLEKAIRSGMSSTVFDVIVREVADSIGARNPQGRGLTEAEARFLVESGDFTQEEFDETEKRVALGELAQRERAARMNLACRRLSGSEVARLLGIDETRVRHRQAKNNLFGYLVGRSRVYPDWQFTPENKPLPHLSEIIRAFPTGWHPASIDGFMTTPQEDLTGGPDGRTNLSPVDWLLGGGDLEPVLAILHGVRHS